MRRCICATLTLLELPSQVLLTAGMHGRIQLPFMLHQSFVELPLERIGMLNPTLCTESSCHLTYSPRY